MEYTTKLEGATLTVAIDGRLDTINSNALSDALSKESGFTDIVFDFANVQYLSSSGIRLLFSYRKSLGGKDHVIVKNANAVVMEIFRVTGFDKQITLQ